jgi:hypothetical protein
VWLYTIHTGINKVLLTDTDGVMVACTDRILEVHVGPVTILDGMSHPE